MLESTIIGKIESTIIIWYIYLSIINCVWMHKCECLVISLSNKCQCILIWTYTVNEVNLNLFLVWPRSLEWTVDGCKNGASKWTNYKNYKNLLYVILVGKTFHLITNINIRVQILVSKRGRASIGYCASIGTYTVAVYGCVCLKDPLESKQLGIVSRFQVSVCHRYVQKYGPTTNQTSNIHGPTI